MKEFIKNKLREKLSEIIEIPVEVGDTILMGKFKNKKVVVKDIEWDEEKGDLKINGKPALKMRLVKKIKEEISRFPGHKIPVGQIYPNDNVHGGPDGPNWDLMRTIDVYQDDATFEREPIESVDIRKIIPTQRFVSKQNLEDVKGTLHNDNTGAYLIKYNGLYYISDGHHRIAARILDGQTIIKAYVYTI